MGDRYRFPTYGVKALTNTRKIQWRHVLGQLSEDEELSIELRLLGNVPYGEEMDSVTANLIDDYLAKPGLSANENGLSSVSRNQKNGWLS